MRVILTRPQAQADAWLSALSEAGFETLSWPLIEIRPTRDPSALHRTQERAHHYQALMFVSPNAVAAFFESNSHLASVLTAQAAIKNIAPQGLPRVWATGAATVQALLAKGVDAQQIDAPAAHDTAESEALWARVQTQVQAGSTVLIVRGANAQGLLAGRPWLAQQLAQCGAQVSEVAAYERHAPVWSDQQQALANAALQDGSVWLWSSSEALHNLPGLPALAAGGARAVATHPRIALAARERGFAQVVQSRPELPALVRSIQSLA